MKQLSLRTKTLISAAIFAAIFITLVCVATFYDLRVSQILTASALPKGEYLATDFFGVTGEIIGSTPVYLLIAFCTTILFTYFIKVWKLKPLKYILAAAFFIGGTVAFWYGLHDINKYIIEHALRIDHHAFCDNAALTACEVMVSLLLNTLAVLAARNLKEETVKKLCKVVIAAAVAAIIANVLIMLVKDPVGRMRYRAMNSNIGQEMGGFANFTKWYEMNGQPDEATLKAFEGAYGVTDAFKSFPSGHTCAAGMSYMLILLPDALGIKKKGARFACWAVPITVTGLVAISRIVCGAHYMSDVTFGGTIAFVCMLLMREIVICKCSHLKALFGKKQAALPQDDQLVTENND